MKNVIEINFNNQAKVDLVTRLNTGTNEVWLSIIGANNGVINLGDITVSITSDNFKYEISSNLWVGDGQLEISVRNSSMMGFYRINKIDELTGDIYIQQDAPNLFTLVRGSNDGGLVHKDVEFEDWEQMTPEEQADGTEYFVWNGGSAKIPLDYFYPIGSIYMSVNNISPALLFGGTWEKIENKFLLGSGSDYTLGNEGGEATHTLSVDEMPSHNHGSRSLSGGLHLHGEAQPNIIYGTSGIITAGGGSSTQFRSPTSIGVQSGAFSRGNFAIDATHTHDSNGGGQAHNNMPPYLVVNIWVRVADPEETSEG